MFAKILAMLGVALIFSACACGGGGGGGGGNSPVTSTFSAPPAFSAQPISPTISAPAPATFTVVVSGAPSLQWQISTDRGVTWTNIGGATAVTYTTPATASADNGKQFRVIASNSGGMVTSTAATLTIAEPVVVFGRLIANKASLYLINADGSGSTSALAVNGDNNYYAGSTDNGKIIFYRQTSIQNAFYSINRDGTGLTALLPNASSPDFVGIAASNRVILTRYTATFSTELVSVNSDGTGVSAPLLIGDSTERVFYHGVTADGRVVYSKFKAGQSLGIFSSNVQMTAVVTVETGSPNLGGVCSVRPNGLIVFNTVKDVNAPFADSDLFTINADGSRRTALATTTAAENCAGISSTGQIIFTRTTDTQPQRDLFGINADGSSLVALAQSTDDETYAGSTASGKILYLRDVGGQPDLYIVNADGSGQLALANSTDAEIFQGVAPSGRVIFQRAVNAQGDLFSINADGSGLLALAAAPTASEETRAVTADGRVIYLTDTTGMRDLYIVNADSTGRRLLAADAYFAGLAK